MRSNNSDAAIDAVLSCANRIVNESATNDLTALPALRVIFGSQLDSPRWQQWLKLASAIEGFPRHLGFAFLAVEDPTGMVNVVVHPTIYERERQAVHGAFVLIEGVLQIDRGAISVVAKRISGL